MAFSMQKAMERMNSMLEVFEKEKPEKGSISDTVMMTLYWIKYGKDQPDPEIQKRVDEVFLNGA